MIRNRFVVVPHPERRGYTIKDTTGKATDMIGPGCTAGYYRYKYDALARVEEWNKEYKLPFWELYEIQK